MEFPERGAAPRRFLERKRTSRHAARGFSRSDKLGHQDYLVAVAGEHAAVVRLHALPHDAVASAASCSGAAPRRDHNRGRLDDVVEPSIPRTSLKRSFQPLRLLFAAAMYHDGANPNQGTPYGQGSWFRYGPNIITLPSTTNP